MTTSNGLAHQAPLYVRALRLRHLRIGGFVSFLLFECMIAAGVLLALAELVSWWAVPVLPAVVAIMVKVNDMVIGGSRRARAQARSAALGSSDRASSTRVESDARTDETPSATRRTTTALDRAEIARAGARTATGARVAAAGASTGSHSASGGAPTGSHAAGGATSGSHGAAGATTGSHAAAAHAADGDGEPTGARTAGTTVRTRVIEPPAQRKKVGVIRISVPARDGVGAPRHGADDGSGPVDNGHGISPGTDEPTRAPAARATSEPVVGGSSGSGYDAGVGGSGYEDAAAGNGAGLSAVADEWTDTDSHGFQRSRPMYPGWTESAADGAAEDPWAGAGAAAADGHYAAGTHGQYAGNAHADYADAGHGQYAGNGYAQYDDGGRGQYAGGGQAPYGGPWAGSADGTANGNGSAQSGWSDGGDWGDRRNWAEQQRPVPAGQHASADWDDEGGWDQAAWGGGSRSSAGTSSWGSYPGWDGTAPDYAADYTGEDTGSRAAYGPGGREQAARDLAARGEAYRYAAQGDGSGRHGHGDSGSYDSGYGDAGSGDGDYGSRYGDVGYGDQGYGDSGRHGAGYEEEGGVRFSDRAPLDATVQFGRIVDDEVRGYDVDAGGPVNTGYARDTREPRDGDGRTLNREAAGGGRHARQQPPGRRRSEDGDNETTGHYTTGRHAERAWRSEDDLARQRTGGGVNQGRFA